MLNNIIDCGKDLINNIKEKIISKKQKHKNCLKKKAIQDKLYVSERQLVVLQKLISSVKTRSDIKLRAKIIVERITNPNITLCATNLNTSRSTIYLWQKRWSDNQNILNTVEFQEPHKLKKTIIGILTDNYRVGAPPKFKSEQVAAIIYLSLQEPKLLNLPISNWTAKTLKESAIKLNIVDNISERQVKRYLSEMDINVHSYSGWLNSMESNPDFEEYKSRVKKICDIYINSEHLEKEGIVILSTDEKTGIQAIEHKHPSKPVRFGSCQKIEQEYKRNGTTTLIATRDINTGKIIPMLNPTRTEEDFEKHINDVLDIYKCSKKIIIIMDQLNTHMSESLVKLIAKQCNIEEELGIKGTHGILKSMTTRAKFLEDESHKIQVVFTPKHCSWLNQIELWFGILTKQLLNRRYSFKSVEELNSKILEYISYYNENLSKKFKWNYEGKILKT